MNIFRFDQESHIVKLFPKSYAFGVFEGFFVVSYSFVNYANMYGQDLNSNYTMVCSYASSRYTLGKEVFEL